MNKPILPDAIRHRLRYPFLGDVWLNVWALTGIGLALAIRWGLHHTWLPGGSLRLVIVLLPLLPSYLYARRLIVWTKTSDEMQRRILQEALLFAAMWTVLLRVGLDLLTTAYGGSPFGLHFGLGVEGTFVVMCTLYLLGCILANRRYQ